MNFPHARGRENGTDKPPESWKFNWPLRGFRFLDVRGGMLTDTGLSAPQPDTTDCLHGPPLSMPDFRAAIIHLFTRLSSPIQTRFSPSITAYIGHLTDGHSCTSIRSAAVRISGDNLSILALLRRSPTSNPI